MSIHWYKYSTPELAAQACSRHILLRLEEALAGKSTASLAISGGSTPKLMLREMAKADFEWDRVHLFWVDERAVAPTHDESNYRMAEEVFVKPAHFPHRNLHRIHGELRPDVAADQYAIDIEEHFNIGESNIPHFDVVHLGLGAEAHTASLFPGEPLIQDRQGTVSAVYVEKLAKWRITLLPGVFLNAKHVVMLVSGADKADALQNVMEGAYHPVEYPAQLISHHCRHVTWFVDEAAASKTSM